MTKKPPVYARHDWISQSQFEPLEESEILLRVAERVSKAKATGTQAVVIFDLDSTLYEVSHRTTAIISEWVGSGHELLQHVLHALGKLRHEQVGYSLKDTFKKLGLDLANGHVEKAHSTLSDFWWDRFFSGDYVKHDIPYPGSVEFVNHVFALGAHVAYLTGRDEKKMREGTVRKLKADGFPFYEGKTNLFMKTDPSLNDVEFKRQAAEAIMKLGNVIASFENEPQNVVVLSETLPNALHIFMHTVCSEQSARPLNGIYKLKGFTK